MFYLGLVMLAWSICPSYDKGGAGQPQTHQVLRHVTNWQWGQFGAQSIGFLHLGDNKLLELSPLQLTPIKQTQQSILWSIIYFFYLNLQLIYKCPFSMMNDYDQTSSSYPVYSAHKKLWSESKKERKMATHTHKEAYDQKIPHREWSTDNLSLVSLIQTWKPLSTMIVIFLYLWC